MDYFVEGGVSAHLADWAAKLGFTVKTDFGYHQKSCECGYIAARVAFKLLNAWLTKQKWMKIPVKKEALDWGLVTSGNAIIEEKYKRKDLLDMTASARRGVPWKKTARFINGPEVIALFHEHINADYGEGGNDTINRKCSNQAKDQLFKTLAELVHNVVKKKEACTECIIANTDNQDQPGIHWYTVMVDLHPCDSDDDINT